jgi:hypothetical protein
MSSTNKPATWFWIVSVIALVWNLMGVMAYIAQVTMSAETLQAMPENERALYESAPTWATAAFAIAVWGGALGSILLLIRKKWATAVLIVSFIGIVVQMIHSFFISKAMDVYGPGGLAMPIMVLAFGAGLIWFSRKADANGWLN